MPSVAFFSPNVGKISMSSWFGSVKPTERVLKTSKLVTEQERQTENAKEKNKAMKCPL